MKEDDLYLLVRNMEPGEKRGFLKARKYKTRTERRKKYLELFVLIDKASPPGDKSLRKALDFGEGSALAMLKTYLYDELLDFLAARTQTDPIDRELSRRLNQVRYLRQAGLPRQAERLIRKVYAKACKYERFTLALEALRIMLLLVSDGNYRQDVHHFLNHEFPQAEALMGQLSEFHSAMHDFAQGLYAFRSHVVLTEDLVPARPDIRTFHARSYHQKIRAILLNVRGAYEESYALRRETFEMFQAHPHFQTDRYQLYLSLLYNLCHSAITMGRVEEGVQYLLAQRAVLARLKGQLSPRYETLYALHSGYCELLYCWKREGVEAAMEIVLNTDSDGRWNDFHGVWLEHSLSIRTVSIFILLYGKAYDRALRSAGRLRLDVPSSMRVDLHAWCEVLSLYLNFLTGDELYLHTALRNALRKPAPEKAALPEILLRHLREQHRMGRWEGEKGLELRAEAWKTCRATLNEAWPKRHRIWEQTLEWLETVFNV